MVDPYKDVQSKIIHACILPAYKEDIDTLKDTLDVLASSELAKTNTSVWLAREEKDPQARSVAAELERSYASSFRSIQSTFHPAGLPGEAQGKSSNVSWAAKHAMRKFVEEGLEDKVILTVMDADTHLSPDYFVLVSNMHANSYKTHANISLYVPPVIFDRNTHKVPALVRLADLTWSAASLSGTYPGSHVCIPTSVYSVPLALAEAVGGWDVGPEAIGEDMHMFLKCYFFTRGALITRPVPSAASHCNVDSDKAGIWGWLDGLRARWKQGFRHMWGALDYGYAFRSGLAFWGDTNGHDDDLVERRPLPKFRTVMLYLRLFEAHCLPVQLSISMLGAALFQAFIPVIITPTPMYVSLAVCNKLPGIAFVLMQIYFHLYRCYHDLCLGIRVEDSTGAGLGDRMDFSSGSTGVGYWVECLMFPIAGTLFGAIPALVAQMWHLFTDDLLYTVSSKPLKQPVKRPEFAL